MPASKSRTICPGLASPSSTRSAILAASACASAARQLSPASRNPALSVRSSSTRPPAGGSPVVPRLGQERRVALAEVAREHLVHDVDHVRTRAMVPAKRDELIPRRGPLLAVDRDVGVAEPIDALELVADEEELAAGDEVDQLALKPVRVLELVDEHVREPLAVRLGQVGPGEQEVARAELEVGEVHQAARVLQVAVRRVEQHQQPLELGQVGRGQVVAGGLLEIAQGVEVCARWPRPCADGTRRDRSGRVRGRRRAAPRGRRPSPTRRAQRRPTSLRRAPRPGRSARPAAGRAGARRCEGARGRRGSSGAGGAGRRWRGDRAGGRGPPPGTARARGRTPRAGASPSARRRRSQSEDRGRPRRRGRGGCEGRSDGSSRSTRCRRPGPAPSRRPARAPRAPGA